MLFFTFFLLVSKCLFTEALTDEEVKLEMTKSIMDCTKDFPVDMGELINLQMLKTPKTKPAKCLLACSYKREGTMNDKGMIDPVHTAKRAKQIASDDEKRLVRAIKLAETCNKVNEVKVSDGEKGCDRAALMFECFIKTAPKLGFKV